MKRMIWTKRNEVVLVMGVDLRTSSAIVMTKDEYYMTVPLPELKLTTEDYNRVFAN